MLKAWKNAYHKRSNNVQLAEASNSEREAVKELILEDVGRAIKLLLQYGLSEESVKSDCWVGHDLCQRLDEALRHGLRRPGLGYWPFVRIVTHTNNVCMLEKSAASLNTLDTGRAWLHHSLNEGSLESYLRAFSCENGALRKHYSRESLLRDPARREVLLGLLASLRDVHFELGLESCEVRRATITPLPSPEDSGVALLDSDLSEPLDSLQDDQDDDTATLNELEDNRINRLLSLEMDTAGKNNDPCIPQLNELSETITSEKSDRIILRTPKKSSNESNRHLKRVSFHEECLSPADFSVSFVTCGGTAVPKKDTVKGRYSWCAGGDAPFVVCDMEPKTNSICVLQRESGEERGAPEGQEDSPLCCERPSRTKLEVLRIRRRQLLKKQSKIKRSLHWPGAKPNVQACQQLVEELNQELEQNMQRESVGQPVNAATLNVMRVDVFLSPSESIYKVLKAHGPLLQTEILPLLIVLTDQALYVLSSATETFKCHFSLSYKDLQAFLLGPGGQTVVMVGVERQQVMLAMQDVECASNLVAGIEWAMRKARTGPLPAWRWLAMEDMRLLWHNLAQLVPALQGERLLHHCLAHLQDETKQCATLPPASREGLLMMRIGQAGPWVPAFLGLRESELWVFGDEVQREPQLVLSLARCQGCHRAPLAERPHAFEILCGRGSSPLQLAAADEYEASEWLQALLQAASGPVQSRQSQPLQLCGLVLSAGHLLTYSLEQPAPQLVCCTQLPHLTAIRTPTTSSNWCVLEFECSEAHESSGDWVLYFSSQVARARFCAQLEAIWPTLFQAPFPSSTGMSENLLTRCTRASEQLRSAWDPLLSLSFNADRAEGMEQ